MSITLVLKQSEATIITTCVSLLGLVALAVLSHTSLVRGIGFVSLGCFVRLLWQSNFQFEPFPTFTLAFLGAAEAVLIWQLPMKMTARFGSLEVGAAWPPMVITAVVFASAVVLVMTTAMFAARDLQKAARESGWWNYCNYLWVLSVPYSLLAIGAAYCIFA